MRTCIDVFQLAEATNDFIVNGEAKQYAEKMQMTAEQYEGYLEGLKYTNLLADLVCKKYIIPEE